MNLARNLLLDKTGLTLNPIQVPFVNDTHTFKALIGGERSGKSFLTAIDAVTRIPFGKLFWVVGPDYDLPRREFSYILDFLVQLGAVGSRKDVSQPQEGQWTVTTKSGQVIMTRTAADVRKLAADPVDGIIITEAAQCPFSTVLKAFGRISETHGWLTVEGTLEGESGWYAEIVREMLDDPTDNTFLGTAHIMPTWSNLAIFPGGRNDPAIKHLERVYGRVPGLFDERCGAIPAPPMGVIFRDFSHVKHVNQAITFNPGRPVYLAIDPGHGGPSAYVVLAIQTAESVREYTDPDQKQFDAIEHLNVLEGSLYLPGLTTEDAIALSRQQEWWPNVVGGVIDVEAPDERLRWTNLGKVTLAASKVYILEGERRLHTFLVQSSGDERPPLQYSAGVDPAILREYSEYKSAVSSAAKMDTSPGNSVRLRRGSDHALKALWYFLVYRYGPVKQAFLPTIARSPLIERLLQHVNLFGSKHIIRQVS